ncbi:MAG: Ig-like domain-containing protein [Myxococcales bacterium]
MPAARQPAPGLVIHPSALLALTLLAACDVPFSVSGRCSQQSDCAEATWCVDGLCRPCPACAGGEACVEGRCAPGCTIDGEAQPAGSVDPSSPCRTCQPDLDPSGYRAAFEGEAGHCLAGERCRSGVCVGEAQPSVSITSPSDGALIGPVEDSASFPVSGHCSESGREVTLEVDGAAAGGSATCDGTTFAATLDTLGLGQGGHWLVAVHASSSGAVARSTTVTLIKDTLPPSIAITSLAHGGYVNRSNQAAYSIAGSCSEDGATVSLAVGPALATGTCVASAWGFALDLTALPEGPATVTVTATDAAGNQGSDAATLEKSTTIPSLAPTSPQVPILGTLTFTASGTRTPYTFSLASGAGLIDAATGEFEAPASPGNARVQVEDLFGNTAATDVTITPLGPLAFTVLGVTGPSDTVADGYLQHLLPGGEFATITWSASANAATYRAAILDVNGATVVCTEQTVSTLSASFASCPLVPGARYLATVVADNGAGDTLAAGNSPYPFLVNRAPVARDDSAIALSEATFTLNVRGNDSDPDGQALVVVAVGLPMHGTATTDGAVVTYRSESGYRGDESFGYTISDGTGGTASAAVSLKVALPQTWTGEAGDASWQNAKNWIPPAVPAAGEVAHFDSTCIGVACACTIDVPVAIQGLELAASYPGTLTQASGNTVALGTSAARTGSYLQAGGTFLGSANSATSFRVFGDDAFRLLGGAFRAPAGELRIESNQVDNTPVTIAPAATFQHGSGTLFIGHASGACTDTVHRIDVTDHLAVNHLTLGDSGGGCGGSKTFDLLGRTIDVGGTLRLAGGDDVVSNGNLDLWGAGNVFQRDALDPRGGTALIRFLGASAQVYTINQASTGWPHPGFVIDKTGGEVGYAGTGPLVLESLQVLAGTFRAPTTGSAPLELSGANGQPHTVLQVAAGATLMLGNLALFVAKPGNPGNCDPGGPYLIDVPAALQFNDVHFAMFDAGCTHLPQWSIQPGSALTVNGRFWAEIGSFSGGALALRGALDIGASGGGTSAVRISGGAPQAFSSSGGRLPGGPISIDKSGGSFELNADFRAVEPGQTLLMAGNSTVHMTGHAMTIAGSATMVAPATINKGGGTLTVNGSAVGTGTGNMFGTGTVSP